MFSTLLRLLVAAALIVPAGNSLDLPADLGVFALFSALILAVVFSSLFRARGGARCAISGVSRPLLILRAAPFRNRLLPP